MSVSKSGSTKVATAKLLAIADKLGFTVETKTGWLLMYSPGRKAQRLLVHTGKRGTNCAELVGFESPHAITHPCPPAKTMTQMIDFNQPEKEVLRLFYKTGRILFDAAQAASSTPVAAVPSVSENTASSTPPPAPAESEEDRLIAMKERGEITEEEFEFKLASLGLGGAVTQAA